MLTRCMESPSVDTELEWLALGEDETLVWHGEPDDMSLVPYLTLGIPMCLLLIGIPFIAYILSRHYNMEYVITTTGLYKKGGGVSRTIKRVEFDEVQNTSYRQLIGGSAFNYGTVLINTAGGVGVEMMFENVAEPQKIHTLINDHRKD